MSTCVSDIKMKVRLASDIFQNLKDTHSLNNYWPFTVNPSIYYAFYLFDSTSKTIVSQQIEVTFKQCDVKVPS